LPQNRTPSEIDKTLENKGVLQGEAARAHANRAQSQRFFTINYDFFPKRHNQAGFQLDSGQSSKQNRTLKISFASRFSQGPWAAQR